jgi:hypothetical protein
MVNFFDVPAILGAIHGAIHPAGTHPAPPGSRLNIAADLPASSLALLPPSPSLSLSEDRLRDHGASDGRVNFTIINQHTAAVKTLFTRGCDSGVGWAPFPTFVSVNGTEYDELQLTGFDGVGGRCDDTNPHRKVHLAGDVIEVNKTSRFLTPIGWHGKMSLIEAEYNITGSHETLLEGSLGYQQDGHGAKALKLDFDVSMV